MESPSTSGSFPYILYVESLRSAAEWVVFLCSTTESDTLCGDVSQGISAVAPGLWNTLYLEAQRMLHSMSFEHDVKTSLNNGIVLHPNQSPKFFIQQLLSIALSFLFILS